MKKIFISSDHAGYNLKELIKKKFSNKYKFEDLGTNGSKVSVNYPDFAHKLCKKISKNSKNIGILVCGSGMGMSMAANRHKKIRAAVCYSIKNTKLSRLHNNANIITLGSRLTNKNTAFKCIEVFVNTKFEGGRHKKIRAAVCYSVKNTKLSRLHNNANIITLGSRLTKKNTAFKCIEVFINTKFEGGRHKKRVKKI